MKISTSIKLLVLGAALIAAGRALHTVRHKTSPEQVRQSVINTFESALDAQLSIGRAAFHVAKGLELENVAVRPPESDEVLLKCRRITAQFDLTSLLGSRPVVRRASIIQPAIQLQYLPEAHRWNLQAIRMKAAGRGGASQENLRDGLFIHDARLQLVDPKLFHDDRSRSYEGLYLSLRRDTANPRRWQFQGRLDEGPLAGTRLRGHFTTGKDPELRLEFQAENLQIDQSCLQLIPAGSLIRRNYQPEGLVHVKGFIASKGGQPTKWQCDVTLLDVTGRAGIIPARMRQADGNIVVSDEKVMLRDLTALVSPPGCASPDGESMPISIEVEARHEWDGARHYSIAAHDIPLCKTTINWIPGVGPALWDRLKPQGEADLRLTIQQQDPKAKTLYKTRFTLRDATLRPREIPLPLEQVNGTILVDRHNVIFNDVNANIAVANDTGKALPAGLAVQGRYDLDGDRSDLQVRVSNLRTTEELVEAIPGCGEQLWRQAKPQVALDGRLSLRAQGADGDLSVEGTFDLHGGRILLDFWPVPLEDVAGTLRLENQSVLLEDVTARLGSQAIAESPAVPSGLIAAQGAIDLGKDRGDIAFNMPTIALDEEIVRSVPEVGQWLWEHAHPKGLASLKGDIHYDGGREEPVNCHVEVALHDVAVNGPEIPVPVQGLSGDLLITNRRAVGDDLTAVACSGRVRASVVAHYGKEAERPTYAGTLELWRLDLGELIHQWTGKPQELSGILDGAVDFGGVAGSATGIAARGRVALTEGRLWEMPFFAGLLGVLHFSLPLQKPTLQYGEMSFDRVGGQTKIKEFELAGAGLQITGRGDISEHGELEMRMVVMGAPQKGNGIPLVSNIMGWVMRGVERQLFRVDVSGTLGEPQFSLKPLRRIMWPITSLGTLLSAPIFGGESEKAK